MNLPLKFFKVSSNNFAPNDQLPCMLYLFVNNRPVLFRKKDDAIPDGKLEYYVKNNIYFYIDENDKDLYYNYLKSQISNNTTDPKQKAVILKTSALLHVEQLFTTNNYKKLYDDSKLIISSIMEILLTDVKSLNNLIKLSVHDYYTYNHCADVAIYTMALANKFGIKEKTTLSDIGLGGLLHDIGKRDIPLEVINKPGPLNEEEWKIMKKHPVFGMDIISTVPNMSPIVKSIVRHHHESYSGGGYPDGLKGDEIGLYARITTIADIYDALTTDRPYAKGITPQDALKLMREKINHKFDPNLFGEFSGQVKGKKAA